MTDFRSDFPDAPVVVHGPYEGSGRDADPIDGSMTIPLYLTESSKYSVSVDTAPKDVATMDADERIMEALGTEEDVMYSGTLNASALVPQLIAPFDNEIRDEWGAQREALCRWLFMIEGLVDSPQGTGYAIAEKNRPDAYSPEFMNGFVIEETSWTWKSESPMTADWTIEFLLNEGVGGVDTPLESYVSREFDSQFDSPEPNDVQNVDPSLWDDVDVFRIIGGTEDASISYGHYPLNAIDEIRHEREVDIDRTKQFEGFGDDNDEGSGMNMAIFGSGIQSSFTVSGKMYEEQTEKADVKDNHRGLDGFIRWMNGLTGGNIAIWDGLTFRMFEGAASKIETSFEEGQERWVDYRLEIDIGSVPHSAID